MKKARDKTTFFPKLNKPKDGKRHENLNSTRHHLKREVKDKLTKDHQRWTDEQLDQLLEAFLIDKNHWLIVPGFYIRHSKQHAELLGRSSDGAGTALRKLAIRFESYEDYKPQRRTNRSDKPFDEGDHLIMQLAFNQTGVLNGACKPVWLTKILGRTNKEVCRELNRLAVLLQPKGFFDLSNTMSRNNEVLAEVIEKALLHLISDLMDRLKKGLP